MGQWSVRRGRVAVDKEASSLVKKVNIHRYIWSLRRHDVAMSSISVLA